MSRNTTIARPYAKAIFLIAQKENAFDQWSSMMAYAGAVAQNKYVVNLIKDPQFSAAYVVEYFEKVGKDIFSKEANNFIEQLGRFKRLALLPEIAKVYEDMRAQAERTVAVEMTSAFALNDAEKQRFEKALEKRMDSKIRLEYVIDPAILGGAIIRAGDLVIDGSVRGKLAKLSEAMGIY
jgi:F-type H+-transporting ATPase subunit delta